MSTRHNNLCSRTRNETTFKRFKKRSKQKSIFKVNECKNYNLKNHDPESVSTQNSNSLEQHYSESAKITRLLHDFYKTTGKKRCSGYDTHVCTNNCTFWNSPGCPEFSVCCLSHKVHKCDSRCLLEDEENTVCTLTSNVIHMSKHVYHTSINTHGQHENTMTNSTSYTPKNNSSISNVMAIINRYVDYCEVPAIKMGVLKSVSSSISQHLEKNNSNNYSSIKTQTLSLFLLFVKGLTCTTTGSIIVEKNDKICSKEHAEKLWSEFPYEKVYNKILLSLYDVYDDGKDLIVIPATSTKFSSTE